MELRNFKIEAKIYEASRINLLKLVQSQKDSVKKLMLLGHNPGFTEFMQRLDHTTSILTIYQLVDYFLFN